MKRKFRDKIMANTNQETLPTGFGGISPSDPLMRKYLELQVRQMERQEAERMQVDSTEQEMKRRKMEMQKREADDAEGKRKAVLASQEHCPHKQGALSLVRGQRLGGNKHHIFCQFCLKTWADWSQVHPTLHSAPEYYGGPHGF
jgi:hypothetical protein